MSDGVYGVHLVVTRIAGKSTISDSYVSSFVDEVGISVPRVL